ncbi:hypothetical protein BGX38DRAFT_1191787 [Terfezia claveryi]|nr:hypothetical protein BGX38DRAFT_1191787 [Terfezia claveryi]
MTIPEAEKRLGVRLDELETVPIVEVLGRHKSEVGDGIKEKVYERILEYLKFEGYPTEASVGYKEVKVSDLVLYTIGPILSEFTDRVGRKIRLEREKEIISTNKETTGYEEFLVIDRISVTGGKFCCLALKDAKDTNGGGYVYGFITTGERWRLITYNGQFHMTYKMDLLLDRMHDRKEKWMKDHSVLVDCIWFALGNGGIMEEKEVVG